MQSEARVGVNILGQEIHAVQYEDVLRHVDQVHDYCYLRREAPTGAVTRISVPFIMARILL